MFNTHETLQIHSGHYENDVSALATAAVRGVHAVRSIHENRESLSDETCSWMGADGVMYWVSNDRPVPTWVFTEAGLICPKHQADEHAASQAKAIEAFRACEPTEPSEEELFEARAAHGPGVELVNVITGRKFTT